MGRDTRREYTQKFGSIVTLAEFPHSVSAARWNFHLLTATIGVSGGLVATLARMYPAYDLLGLPSLLVPDAVGLVAALVLSVPVVLRLGPRRSAQGALTLRFLQVTMRCCCPKHWQVLVAADCVGAVGNGVLWTAFGSYLDRHVRLIQLHAALEARFVKRDKVLFSLLSPLAMYTILTEFIAPIISLHVFRDIWVSLAVIISLVFALVLACWRLLLQVPLAGNLVPRAERAAHLDQEFAVTFGVTFSLVPWCLECLFLSQALIGEVAIFQIASYQDFSFLAAAAAVAVLSLLAPLYPESCRRWNLSTLGSLMAALAFVAAMLTLMVYCSVEEGFRKRKDQPLYSINTASEQSELYQAVGPLVAVFFGIGRGANEICSNVIVGSFFLGNDVENGWANVGALHAGAKLIGRIFMSLVNYQFPLQSMSTFAIVVVVTVCMWPLMLMAYCKKDSEEELAHQIELKQMVAAKGKSS